MRAMVLRAVTTPLRLEERSIPQPQTHEILVEIAACAVCRTDLHVVDGELPETALPIVPGHEIVGRVAARGPAATQFNVGDRVGIPWLGGTCGSCVYCREGRENLCDQPVFTGYSRDGGFATHTIADARFALPIPEALGDAAAAPLLCAGLIGWRCLKKAGTGRVLGLYGFGAAAHLMAQVAVGEGRRVYAFIRDGDFAAQTLATTLGCAWAGGSSETPPEPLDAAIVFAPVGALVPEALRNVRKGGRVVCGGIHMSDLPPMPYRLLWGEREICSVANLTRADGHEFLQRVSAAPLQVKTTQYALEDTNKALSDLRNGALTGAAVIIP